MRAIKGVIYINPGVRDDYGHAYEEEMGTADLNALLSEEYVGRDGLTRLSKNGVRFLKNWFRCMGEAPAAYMLVRIRDCSTDEWSYTRIDVRR